MRGKGGLLLTGAVLLFLLALAPWASQAPDGLEYTVESYSTHAEAEAAPPENEAPESAAMVVLSGTAGAAIVLGLGWVWGWARQSR